jgi:methyl-accepting chemotaxis protein
MTAPSSSGAVAVVRRAFTPATWLLNRLRYAPKFVLIGLVFFLPFAYVSYLQFQGTSADVEFNQAEREGVSYLAPTTSYLYALQRHRLFAAAAAAGDPQARAKADEAAADAARWEKEVDAVDARVGGLLRTTARWREAKAAWAAARDGRFASAREADQAHAAANAVVADLIVNYVGNYSKLILDPDLDSYWLMDAVILKLPFLGNTTAQLAAVALVSSADATSTQLELAGLSALIDTSAGDLKAVNLATAIKETKNFGRSRTLARLSDPMEQLSVTLAGTRAAALREYGGVAPTRNPSPVIDATAQSLAQLHGFAGAIIPELDGLIAKRVARYQVDRRNALIAAVVASVLLVYLFVGFFFAVRDSIAAIGDATRRMIAGTTERFALSSKDELGQVAVDYNAINAALVESRTLQAKVQKDNDELQENIMQLLVAVSDASDGNLTTRAPITAGALGNVADAFNQLMESLQALIGDVKAQVEQTRSVAEQINQASQAMTQGATRQALEVKEATAIAEQMAVKMRDVSRDAANAAEAARNTEASAVDGQRSVEDVIGGMEGLRQNVQAGAKKMKGLGDRSMEITTIVSTINRISEQTNMLALNAAIEAARAGEHGRGFSVVAEEVRKLAERTAAATNEIEKLVKAIHVETNETVAAIEHQTQIVEQEAQVVGNAGVSLRKIREVSTRSAELVATITQIANAEAERTRQVVATMTQIQQIAAATQQGADGTLATVGQLLHMSTRLSDSVARFRVAA